MPEATHFASVGTGRSMTETRAARGTSNRAAETGEGITVASNGEASTADPAEDGPLSTEEQSDCSAMGSRRPTLAAIALAECRKAAVLQALPGEAHRGIARGPGASKAESTGTEVRPVV